MLGAVLDWPFRPGSEEEERVQVRPVSEGFVESFSLARHFQKNPRIVSRLVYPYSVVPGGVSSSEAVRKAALHDPAVREHYETIRLDDLRLSLIPADRLAYVSYRKGGNIYWTRTKVRLPQGEPVLSDGENDIRARCGNRISETPRSPVAEFEPSEKTLNTPLLPPLPGFRLDPRRPQETSEQQGVLAPGGDPVAVSAPLYAYTPLPAAENPRRNSAGPPVVIGGGGSFTNPVKGGSSPGSGPGPLVPGGSGGSGLPSVVDPDLPLLPPNFPADPFDPEIEPPPAILPPVPCPDCGEGGFPPEPPTGPEEPPVNPPGDPRSPPEPECDSCPPGGGPPPPPPPPPACDDCSEEPPPCPDCVFPPPPPECTDCGPDTPEVPEPGTWLLAGVGLIFIALHRRGK